MKEIKLRRISGNQIDIERLFSKPIHPLTPERFDAPGGRAPRRRSTRYIAATLCCCMCLLTAYVALHTLTLVPTATTVSPEAPESPESPEVARASRPNEIPKLIHQTWKTRTIPSWGRASSWARMNPAWKHRIWTDIEAAELVRQHAPDAYALWDTLAPVERADVFRYAVVFTYGGVYADIDAECLCPIDTCWPIAGHRGVIGLEGVLRDREEMKRVKFAAMTQYCQWTFAFVPGHPMLRRVLDVVVRRVNAGERDTIVKTGPGAFTAAFRAGEGVLVLPTDAFAVGGYGNAPTVTNASLVRHGFRGSWK